MTIRRGGSIIAGCASFSVNPDNKSITTNSSDQIQSIGVINQNNTTFAIKTWTGTKAQYDAISTKDTNTLYNITDDMQASTYEAYSKNETDTLLTNSISALLISLYPIGSIYIGTQSTCPMSTLISGSTWVKVSEGRVLQGSDSNHNAGTTIEAGLPNITGVLGNLASTSTSSAGATSSGALYWTHPTNYQNDQKGSGGAYGYDPAIDASRSSSIYGNSNTVQPPAFVVNIWQRTA